MPPHILIVAGARPNFVKIAPIMAEIARTRAIEASLVHTGQHYDYALSQAFFDELGIPEPHHHLEVGSGGHAEQTAKVMIGLDPIMAATPFDWCVVVGDVNSTLAAALVASKRNVAVAHVESGLRSGDRTMPEEQNRLCTDALSDLCLASEPSGVDHLRAEGVPDSAIRLVGNTMIDTLLKFLPRARALKRPEALGLRERGYVLLTLHRPSNVDDPDHLRRQIAVMGQVARDLPVVFPVHPRTLARMKQAGIDPTAAGIRVLEPVPYLEFLSLQASARLVITDSGGIQEETTVLRVPCLTVRNSTERPITCTVGSNKLIGSNPDRLLTEARAALASDTVPGRVPELWDGRAAERIVAALAERPIARRV